jgi:hypothetical protein
MKLLARTAAMLVTGGALAFAPPSMAVAALPLQAGAVLPPTQGLLGTAPTSSVAGGLSGATQALTQGNTTALQAALAGTLSSLTSRSATGALDPTSLQRAASALISGNAQAAADSLSQAVTQLVGASGGVIPSAVASGVGAAVSALLSGDAAGALNSLSSAVSAASPTTYDLPGALGKGAVPVVGGNKRSGLLLFFVASPKRRAGAGQLEILGARLVDRGRHIRVRVRCVGSSTQTCRGVVQIRRAKKVIARSARLQLKAGQTRKLVLHVRHARARKHR